MPISTRILQHHPITNSQQMLIEDLMGSLRKKVSEAVEYASKASIYSPEELAHELTTAQTSVLSLFYGFLFGDLTLCQAILQIQVPRLKSTFLRTWLADDFCFSRHDVNMVLVLLSYLVEREILSIPDHIMRIFGGLVEKYGLADSFPQKLLDVFNVVQRSKNSPTTTNFRRTGSLKLRWFQNRNSKGKTKNVDDEELVIVTEEDCMPDSNLIEEDENISHCSENIQKHKFYYRNSKRCSSINKSKEISEQMSLQEHDFVDSDGRNVIHRLAKCGLTEYLRGLLNQKINIINAVDESGKTTLHWAVESGNFSTVELLIKAGADVKAKTANGKTPLDIAFIECGVMSDIWKILLEHGAAVYYS